MYYTDRSKCYLNAIENWRYEISKLVMMSSHLQLQLYAKVQFSNLPHESLLSVRGIVIQE